MNADRLPTVVRGARDDATEGKCIVTAVVEDGVRRLVFCPEPRARGSFFCVGHGRRRVER